MSNFLLFSELYTGIEIVVADHETIRHSYRTILGRTKGVVEQIHGVWFYVRWDRDPKDEPLMALHSSDTCYLRRP